MSKTLKIVNKILLYLIFFMIAINCHALTKWFMNVTNMAIAMIFMAVIVIVNFGWELYHAAKRD